MPETVEKNVDLAKLLDALPHGGKRKLAIDRMGCNPGKINDARDGIVKNKEFLARLAIEAQKLLDEYAVKPVIGDNTGEEE